MLDVYGEELEGLVEDYEASYPECPQIDYRAAFAECTFTPARPLCGTDGALVVRRRFSCGDDDVLGPRLGRQWATIPVEVESAFGFVFDATPATGVGLKLRRCGGGCPPVTEGPLDFPGREDLEVTGTDLGAAPAIGDEPGIWVPNVRVEARGQGDDAASLGAKQDQAPVAFDPVVLEEVELERLELRPAKGTHGVAGQLLVRNDERGEVGVERRREAPLELEVEWGRKGRRGRGGGARRRRRDGQGERLE